MIRLGQAPTLFDVEKNDRSRGKAFALGDGSCVARVSCSLLHCWLIGVNFAAFAAAIQHDKTKTQGTQQFAFTGPSAGLFSGRRAEPIAGEGKVVTQRLHGVIARIDVPVEAEERARRLLSR